jgi:hypothetical protein
LVTTLCADAGAASAAVAIRAAPINANFIVFSSVDDEENMGWPDTFRQLDFCNAGQALLTASSETLARAARIATDVEPAVMLGRNSITPSES